MAPAAVRSFYELLHTMTRVYRASVFVRLHVQTTVDGLQILHVVDMVASNADIKSLTH